MFRCERTFELRHERSDFIGDLPEFFQVVAAVQIEHRTDVQQSRRRMAVKRRFDTNAPHQFLQARDIRWQIARLHRCVFDEARRLGVTFAAREQGKSRFAHRPNEIAFAIGF